MTSETKPRVGWYAFVVLAVLTALNLLNYVDRYIFSALIPYIKADVGYTDSQLGLIGSAFTWIYTFCSPLFGFLGDRYHRGRLIAFGIFVWSFATAGAGISRNFGQMLVSRAAVGVGEANYATISPSLVSDFFTKSRRGLAMSIFQSTVPIGAAIGFLMGGYLGDPKSLGWRNTLYLVGLPGLLAAFAMFLIKEPQRGAMDEPEDMADAKPVDFKTGYGMLLRNPGYMATCFGFAAVTFALGALVFWAPEWMKTDKGLDEKSANTVLGVCAVVGGAVGTILGGIIGDALNRKIRHAYFLVCAVSPILAAIPTLIAVISPTPIVYESCIFIAITLVYLGNGPVNTLVVNLVSPTLRTTATGFLVVCIHVLGDGISLFLVGAVSTWLRDAAKEGRAIPGFITFLGNLFRISPTTQTLSVGLLMMPVALLVGGLIFAWGFRQVRREKAA